MLDFPATAHSIKSLDADSIWLKGQGVKNKQEKMKIKKKNPTPNPGKKREESCLDCLHPFKVTWGKNKEARNAKNPAGRVCFLFLSVTFPHPWVIYNPLNPFPATPPFFSSHFFFLPEHPRGGRTFPSLFALGRTKSPVKEFEELWRRGKKC